MSYEYSAKVSVTITTDKPFDGAEDFKSFIKELLEEEYPSAEIVMSVTSVDDFEDWSKYDDDEGEEDDDSQ